MMSRATIIDASLSVCVLLATLWLILGGAPPTACAIAAVSLAITAFFAGACFGLDDARSMRRDFAEHEWGKR